ncbi:MAG: hypothetical protein ABII82_09900 [Verrucomicrobiota bacterium]
MRLISSIFLLTALLIIGFAGILRDAVAALLRPAQPAPGLHPKT